LEATGVVSGMVVVFHDVTLDIGRTRDLQHRAMRDPLTGLGNRAEFEQRLRTVFEKARHLDGCLGEPDSRALCVPIVS
jgi:GGDEF domain-containing protein